MPFHSFLPQLGHWLPLDDWKIKPFLKIHFFGNAKYVFATMTVKMFKSVWHAIRSTVATQYATGLGHSRKQNTHPALMEYMAQLEEQEVDQRDIYKLYRCLISCVFSYYNYPYGIIPMRN